MASYLRLCVLAGGVVLLGCEPAAQPAPPVPKGAAFPDQWFMHPTAEDRQRQNQLVGKPMPALELSHWIGEAYTPAELQGKVVVLDFWATWCGPCLAQIPHNNKIAKAYKERGVVLLGICTSEDQEKMPGIAQQFGVRYPLARDEKLQTLEDWRLSFFPTYALVDREGKVRGVGLNPRFLEQAIDRLLAEQ